MAVFDAALTVEPIVNDFPLHRGRLVRVVINNRQWWPRPVAAELSERWL